LILSHKPKDASNLKAGEIITYIDSNKKTITHRIVEVITAQDGAISYQTKGDNPINSPDLLPVTPQMVEAVFVLKVPLT
jgi:signal peptidase